MNNKVLVRIYIPMVDHSYEMFIPVNEFVGKVKKMILKCVRDLNECDIDIDSNYVLMNLKTSQVYGNEEIVRDTDIRNATELIILK